MKKPRSNAHARAAQPQHGFGVDHRLFYPVWMACVEFSARDGVSAIMVEGLRDEARQRDLRGSGASQSRVSLHQVGRALDVAVFAGGNYQTEVDPHYREFWKVVQRYDAEYNGKRLIRWGGDWHTLVDACHFEL